MIPDRDYYTDKDGKLTDDPTQYARQIAVKGFLLDERIAQRFGITDTLVSVDEPNAIRRVTGRNAASIQVRRAEEKEEENTQEPQKPAEAEEPKTAEPKVEEPKADAKKPAAKKGEKKK